MSEAAKICSFCGKPRSRVPYMAQSRSRVSVYICWGCVLEIWNMMLSQAAEDTKAKREKRRSFLRLVPRDEPGRSEDENKRQ